MEEELQEVETTRGEKILAIAMVMFLLISGVRILEELQDIPESPDSRNYEIKYGVDVLREEFWALSDDQRSALDLLDIANKQLETADRNYWFAASEYDLMLERGEYNKTIEARYESAKMAYETATAILAAAQTRYDEITTQVEDAATTLAAQEAAMWKEYDSAWRIYQLKVLALRMTFTVPLFIIAIILFFKVRARMSPYMIHTNVLMAFSAILLAYMILDYLWDVLSIITLSLIGAALSAIALAYLKKTLFSFERVSRSRVRKNQCSWCGFPLSTVDDNKYCRDCGKQVMETCQECNAPRFIHLSYCHHCGHPTKHT